MTNPFLSLYGDTFQEQMRTFSNHLLVVIAFFLPLNQDSVKSGFFILIILLFTHKDFFVLLKKTLLTPIVVGFIALWLLHIAGIFYAEQQTIAARYAKEVDFLLYSILIVALAQHRFVYRIFGAFILGVFLSELLSYGYFFELLTKPIPQWLDGNQMVAKNEPSPFTYHVEYGYILALTSAFILLRFINSDSQKEKIALGLFFTTITLNVFLNSARTGYILFFIANIIVLMAHYKEMFLKRLIYFIPFGILILSLAWFSSSNIQREYHETVDSIIIMVNDNNLNSSIGNRVNMLITGISAIQKDHLWLGVGTGMHGEAIYTEAIRTNNTALIGWMPDPFYTGYKPILDCAYTDILVQFGLIGIIVFLLFITLAMKSPQTDQTLSIMKYTILWSTFFYALVSSLFFGILVPTLFVALLSLTVIPKNTTQAPLPDVTVNTFGLYILGSIGLFILSKTT